MKIGIITFHRALNYGAVLQAYASYSYLKELGYEVEIVDYCAKYMMEQNNLFSWYYFNSRKGALSKFKYVVSRPFRYVKWKKTKKKFADFRSTYLNIQGGVKFKDMHNFQSKFDCIIYGSDQIWQKFLTNHSLFEPIFWGQNISVKKKIAYAASMGSLSILEPSDDIKIQKYLLSFSEIMVRESDLAQKVRSLGFSAKLVCDPVFLLSREQWMNLTFKSELQLPKQYIFVHIVQGSSLIEKIVELIANEMKIPVVTIESLSKVNKKSKVEDFLKCISNASMVITTSFHCTAFSVIFKRPFLTMGASSNRVRTMLDEFGLTQHFVEKESEGLIERAQSKVDYEKTVYVTSSKQYLENSLFL